MGSTGLRLPPGAELESESDSGGMRLPPGAELESAPSQSGSEQQQTSSGEQFKQQAWSQAGQNLRQGQFVKAARNIGSLFTSQNPAAVSAVSDTAGALRSVLPQGTPRPKPPVATMQEFQKLPKEQQDAYVQQVAKWQADQYGTSMQLAAGFMTPGSAGNAASDVASSVKNVLPGAMKQRAGELFQSVSQDAGKVKVDLGTATQEAADKLLGWQKMINEGSVCE